MPGAIKAKVIQGAVFISAAVGTTAPLLAADIALFTGGILETDFETRFPEATTKYADSANGQEFAGSPSGEYTSAGGVSVSPMTERSFVIPLIGLTEEELATLYSTLQNKQVDVAIKRNSCGENGLGDGTIYRGYNAHFAPTDILGGIQAHNMTLKRMYDACEELTVNQPFTIATPA